MNDPIDALIVAPTSLPRVYQLNQLQELISQFEQYEQLMRSLDPNIDIAQINQRYSTEKSIFTKVAQWYTSLQWWIKLSLGVVAIGIGLVLNISIWVSVICYTAISLLFTEHIKKDSEYHDRIFDDIRSLKLMLADSIRHVEDIKKSIIEIMQSLSAINIALTQDHAIQQANIEELNLQIDKCKGVIENLTSTSRALAESISTQKDELEAAYALIHKHEATLDQNSRDLQKASDSIKTEVSAIQLQRIELEAKCSELSEVLENIHSGYVAEDDIERRANAILETSSQVIASAKKYMNQDKENIHHYGRGVSPFSQRR